MSRCGEIDVLPLIGAVICTTVALVDCGELSTESQARPRCCAGRPFQSFSFFVTASGLRDHWTILVDKKKKDD